MNGSEKKKACLYARYSSENQSEVSIEYQRKAIEKYSRENNFIIVQEYIDRARTGTNSDRKAFQQMFKDLTGKHEWETILVYSTDRLSRDALIALDSMERFLKGSVNVIFTSQPAYNNNDYASRFARNIQFASDAMQSEVTSDHTHNAMKVKATHGIFLGGPPPLGYDAIVKSNKPISGKCKEKVLVINPKEAQIVRRIFEMFLAGMSYTAMAKELNSKNMKTKNGGKFTKNSFYEILTRKKYKGTYTWNKAPGVKSVRRKYHKGDYPAEEQVSVENGCPPIVSEAVFDKAQERLRASNFGKCSNKTRRYYMLSGMGVLKCRVCGKTMCGEIVSSHGAKYQVYYCPNHKKGVCPTKYVRAELLNNYVAKAVVREMMRNVSIKELNQKVFTNAYLSGIIGKKKRLESKINKLVEAVAYHPSEALLDELKASEHDFKAIENKIQKGEIVTEIKETDRKRFAAKLARYIATTESADIRIFLHNILKEIYVDNENIEVTIEVKAS